ncbi:MAG TPA: hypothetical protein VK571_02365 [Gemmatimonadaceae bacterium]|nr:hypothetical protein [Gemmatimonadaceae bacterium]
MPITLVYMIIPAYLLVGCLLMLAANECLSGCMTRMEFVRGMIVWPVLLSYMTQNFFHDLRAQRRALRRRRG